MRAYNKIRLTNKIRPYNKIRHANVIKSSWKEFENIHNLRRRCRNHTSLPYLEVILLQTKKYEHGEVVEIILRIKIYIACQFYSTEDT